MYVCVCVCGCVCVYVCVCVCTNSTYTGIVQSTSINPSNVHRQITGQIDKQTDRQTDTHTHTHTHYLTDILLRHIYPDFGFSGSGLGSGDMEEEIFTTPKPVTSSTPPPTTTTTAPPIPWVNWKSIRSNQFNFFISPS